MRSIPIMQYGDPSDYGMYVAYIDGPVRGYADRTLLFFDKVGWSYPQSDQKFRGSVYGWIGPLPGMILTVPTDLVK